MNAIKLAANPRKTETIRKLGPVDIGTLRAAVLAIPEPVWDAENAGKPNKFEVLDATLVCPRTGERYHETPQGLALVQ